jgi:hypothetical protein
MKLWNLALFALLGLTSIAYGVKRADLFDIGLGVAVLVGGSLAYLAWRR